MLAGWLAIARAEELTDGSGWNSRFVRQQAVFGLLSIGGMLAVTTLHYRRAARYAYAIFVVVLVLLVVVFFFPKINNAHRWIRIGPIGFQPAEFAKLAFVLAMARYLTFRENYRRLRGLLAPLVVTMGPVVLILKEPDLGMALVFVPVLLVMLFAAGARAADLAIVMVVGLATLPLLWTQMSREQRSRVTALFEPIEASQRPSDDAYHLYQARRMMAMGGVWGSAVAGQPTDDPAAYRLPEARTDFIFCVVAERFGLWGLGGVLALYGLLAWRCARIAAACREPFGRLLVVGISATIGVQVVINTGMTVGLLPITGLSLPMMSYGGSGLLAHGLSLGLVMNVGSRTGYEIGNDPFRYEIETPAAARPPGFTSA
jgi:cell division protein FtsW (lipid II flippase)